MDLVERADELAALHRLLAGSAAGGRVAVLSGEAGAGKSALAAAFASSAGPRAQILWGACDPLLTPRALGPLHDIARALDAVGRRSSGADGARSSGADGSRSSGAADSLSSGAADSRSAGVGWSREFGAAGFRGLGAQLRERMAEGARGEVFDLLLEALDRPPQAPRPVVVLEDLHWADEATLDLVAFLGRRLALCRALLVLTFRDDEIGPDHRLRTVLAGLPPGLVQRVGLPSLSRAAVAALATRSGRDPGSVFDVTGGNPLLVTEVLAAPAAGIPPTVRDLVLSRLAALSEPARAVARLVAVVPARTPSALLGDRVAAAEECLAAGVLVAAGDGLAYRHELLRRAVEESLSPVRRRALHAEVLAGLTGGVAQAVHAADPNHPMPSTHRTGSPGVDPARLVHHAHHAGDADAVLRWGPVAARQAASVGAYKQAVAHLAVVLPLAAGRPATERADLLAEYALAAYHGGQMVDALEARRRELALREELGDPLGIGPALRWVSRLSWWNGRPDEARAAGWRAVEVLGAAPPGPELAAAYSNLSQLFMLADRNEEAVSWGERALDLARDLGDRDVELHALINIGSARTHQGDPAGTDDLRRAHEGAVAAGLDDHAGRALVNLATSAVDRWDFDLAEPALQRLIPFLVARDLDGYHRHVLGHQARMNLARGDWTAAAEDADQALTGPGMPGGALVPALAVRGTLRARRGEPGALDDCVTAAEWAYRTGEVQFVGAAAVALAETYWLAGDLDAAAAVARRGLAVAAAVGRPWFAGELAFWLGRCGQPVPAEGVAEPFRLLIAGEWRAAADRFGAMGCPYAQAEALAGGDPEAALRVYDRLGAAASARRLRSTLRERGLPVPRGPRAATAADPTGLTGRQREVLALLAEGLSNAGIAARLTLSAKTVDHHVSAVLAKLGVASRGQAAAVARKLGNIPHVDGPGRS